MKTSKKILKETWGLSFPILLGMVIGAVVCIVIELLSHPSNKVDEKKETVTVIDTVTFTMPTPVGSTQIGTGTYLLPAYSNTATPVNKREASPLQTTVQVADYDDEDTLRQRVESVELPIIQRHYTDTLYEAWVSGPVDPRLDSIKIASRCEVTTITREIYKPPNRWHVGITAGIGYTAKGLQPYVGLGVTYSIKSF